MACAFMDGPLLITKRHLGNNVMLDGCNLTLRILKETTRKAGQVITPKATQSAVSACASALIIPAWICCPRQIGKTDSPELRPVQVSKKYSRRLIDHTEQI